MVQPPVIHLWICLSEDFYILIVFSHGARLTVSLCRGLWTDKSLISFKNLLPLNPYTMDAAPMTPAFLPRALTTISGTSPCSRPKHSFCSISRIGPRTVS